MSDSKEHGSGKKRKVEFSDDTVEPSTKKGSATGKKAADMKDDDEDDLTFEDPFEDEVEEEDIVDGEGDEKAAESEMKDDAAPAAEGKHGEGAAPRPRVWRPGVDELGDNEELDYDAKAYKTYHKLQTDWPCLSFDFIRDKLGENRTKFPHTLTMVTGTQADKAVKNKVIVLKISDIHRTKQDEESDEEVDLEESDDDDLDEDPTVEDRKFAHNGGVNRVRVMPQKPNVLATWSDTGKVHMWDIQRELDQLNGVPTPSSTLPGKKDPLSTFGGHSTEGFSMDWSPVAAGHLLTGDCHKNIFLHTPTATGWETNKTPFSGHTASVEDLSWSPVQNTVFASCSVDKTVRIWDTRARSKSQLWVAAHKADVNVISWNKKVSHLLVSGGDDGSIKVWDLRNFKSHAHVANLQWHRKAITSVEWHPQDEAVLGATGEDNQLSIWDLSLEDDPESGPQGADLDLGDIPPQLLFVHQGQRNIKEMHFHPQIPSLIISTAEDGFNIFKPSNLDDVTPAVPPAAAPTTATTTTSAAAAPAEPATPGL